MDYRIYVAFVALLDYTIKIQASLSLLLTTDVENIGRTVCVYRFRYREKREGERRE